MELDVVYDDHPVGGNLVVQPRSGQPPHDSAEKRYSAYSIACSFAARPYAIVGISRDNALLTR